MVRSSPLLEGVNKSRWGLLGIVAAGFCLLALPPIGSGSPPTLAQLRANDANLEAKARSAVLGLYSLDAQLTTAQSRLAALESDKQKLRAERVSISRQVRLARLDTHISQSRLADRLRFLYEHGTMSSLDVVMGAKSLEDAMTQLDNFHQVASLNVDVLTQLRTAKFRLARLSHELRLRERSLVETTRAAEKTVTELDQERADRTAYISDLATQRSLNASQIANVEAEARAADVRSQQLSKPAVVQTAAVVQPVAAST